MENKVGRPSKLIPECVMKLEEIFALDGTVEEACFFADISRNTFYEWMKEHPELSDRFEALRNNPVLLARRSVIEGLGDPELALKYLERKRRNEFSTRVETDNTTKMDMNGALDITSSDEIAEEFLTKLKDKKLNEQSNTGRLPN